MNNLVLEDVTNVNENWILKENITEVKGSYENNDYQFFVPSFSSNFQRVEMDETSISSKDLIEKLHFENENITEKERAERLNLQISQTLINKDLDVKRPSSYTNNTQRWIGYIIEIADRKFTAKLQDVDNSDTFEIATFDFKDAFDEQDMIRPGAIFYFSLGYVVNRGTYTKQQILRFQRLSELSIPDFDEASDKAEEISSWLDFD